MEERRAGSVLVNLARRNCKDRTYGDPVEVVLSCGTMPKLSDLMEVANKATGVDVDDMVLAKYVVCKDGRCEPTYVLLLTLGTLVRKLCYVSSSSPPRFVLARVPFCRCVSGCWKKNWNVLASMALGREERCSVANSVGRCSDMYTCIYIYIHIYMHVHACIYTYHLGSFWDQFGIILGSF